MSRTIGHVGNRFGGAKRRVKYYSKKKWRTDNRILMHRILTGMTDYDEALWLYRPRQLVFYWDFY